MAKRQAKEKRRRLNKALLHLSRMASGYHYFLGGSKSVLRKINGLTGIRTGRAIVAIEEVQLQIRNHQRELTREARRGSNG